MLLLPSEIILLFILTMMVAKFIIRSPTMSLQQHQLHTRAFEPKKEKILTDIIFFPLVDLEGFMLYNNLLAINFVSFQYGRKAMGKQKLFASSHLSRRGTYRDWCFSNWAFITITNKLTTKTNLRYELICCIWNHVWSKGSVSSQVISFYVFKRLWLLILPNLKIQA